MSLWEGDATITLRIIVMNVILGIAVLSFVVIVSAAVIRQIYRRVKGVEDTDEDRGTIIVARFGEKRREKDSPPDPEAGRRQP